ncbi:MAG: flagellin [bacterium]|jgi:flagellin
MSTSFVTNVASLQAQDNLRINSEFQNKTIQRLTSGYRINVSGDDAAGLAVANEYRSDITEITQGVRNANDGLSVLQIIDGGLNNISKMLDRMRTLATQSASGTFTGDRATLEAEYSALKTEIDRQAANIGLGTGTTTAGRFNKLISVFIGGGAGMANSQVMIDLSGTTSLVTTNALGLAGTSIDGKATNTTLVAGTFDDGSKYLENNSSQTFRFATATSSYTVTVQGDVDGITGDEIVTQLNAGLAGSGIAVSIDSNSHDLVLSSSGSFAVAIDAVTGTGTQISAAVADNAAIVNTGRYRFAGGTVTAAGGTGVGEVTFTQGSDTYTIQIDGDATDGVDVLFNKARAALAGSSIEVIRLGNQIYFQSAADFSVSRTTDTVTGGFSNITSGMAATSADDAEAATDETANARAAVTALATAVRYLGRIQGLIGTAQNKLQYAINLAQSQIASFSAAESRIRDANIASEAANLTRAQVTQQASLSAMLQANQAPQQLLTLLRS